MPCTSLIFFVFYFLVVYLSFSLALSLSLSLPVYMYHVHIKHVHIRATLFFWTLDNFFSTLPLFFDLGLLFLKTLAYFIRNPGLCTRFQTLAYSFAILADLFTALHHLAPFCSNHVHLPSLRKVVAKGDKKEFPWKIVEYWVRTCGLRSGLYSAVDCGVCSVEWSVECVGRGGVEFAVLSAHVDSCWPAFPSNGSDGSAPTPGRASTASRRASQKEGGDPLGRVPLRSNVIKYCNSLQQLVTASWFNKLKALIFIISTE